MNEPQKLLQEAAAAAQAAAAAAAVTSRSSSVSPAVTTSAASNPYSALAALAVASSGGSPTSPYLRPPLGATSFGVPPPMTGNGGGASADSWGLMNPLLQVQAVLWQQQVQQRLSQIASISGGSPFMNPALALASLGGSFPPPAATQPQPPPLPPLIPTSTTASYIASEAAKSVNTSTPTPTTMGLDNVYREYINKIVEQQGGQKSEASKAAEVMANLIKASEDKTNGNSKPNLFESSSASALPQSSIGVSQAALVAAAAAAGVDVHKPVLQHQVTSPSRNMPVNPARTNGGGRSSGDSGTNPPTYNGKDKVFTCQTCNRSFGYKHVLQNHERTHTGEKPFECKVCNKRFTRDHHLKTHMRLHTGEKPYVCTHCGHRFVQVANLRRHLRVHTGERPYRCQTCLATFSDSNQLRAHIRGHP